MLVFFVFLIVSGVQAAELRIDDMNVTAEAADRIRISWRVSEDGEYYPQRLYSCFLRTRSNDSDLSLSVKSGLGSLSGDIVHRINLNDELQNGDRFYFDLECSNQAGDAVRSGLRVFTYESNDPVVFAKPEAGKSFEAGQNMDIELDYNIPPGDVTEITLEYDSLCGQGDCFEELAKRSEFFYNHSWQIPETLYGADRRLKLSVKYKDGYAFKSFTAYSNTFRVTQRGDIIVTSPAVDDDFGVNEQMKIEYTISSPYENFVETEYALYKGDEKLRDIKPDLQGRWRLDKRYADGNDYRVKVTVGAMSAFSKYFTIENNDLPRLRIDFPVAGDILRVGQGYELKWNLDGEEYFPYTGAWLDMGPYGNNYRRVLPITPWQYDAEKFNSLMASNTPPFEWTIASTTRLTAPDDEEKIRYYDVYVDPDKAEFGVRTSLEPFDHNIRSGKYRLYVVMRDAEGKIFPRAMSGHFYINDGSGVEIEEEEPLPVEGGDKTVSGDNGLRTRLRGRIMIKVEDFGRAYYIHPQNQNLYSLGRPEDAFSVMREQGVGIGNADLYKIPVGVLGDSSDADGDGLSDYLEATLGLDPARADTDGDGYADGNELAGGYSPWGAGRQNIDERFARGQAGRILLQVERNGEAWYVNPDDGKRYFLGRPADAFNVMRSLGLGISNEDFGQLSN